MRSRLVWMFAMVALLAAPIAGWAQQTTGNLRGTVTDESGAVLPGVTVTLRGRAVPGAPIVGYERTGHLPIPKPAAGLVRDHGGTGRIRDERPDGHSGRPRRHGRYPRAIEAQLAAGDHHGHGRSAGRRLGQLAGSYQLLARVGRERAGPPLHLLRPHQRRARRQPVDLDQLTLPVVRFGHQREPVPARRHGLHRAADRRRVAVAEHRRHRGSAGAVARRAG